MKSIHWRRGRQVVQAVSLLLFTTLVIHTNRDVQWRLAADSLMRLDPLAGLAAMISTRRWLAEFVPAILLLATTLVLGRFWCGWLCPLGTLLDWVSPHSRKDVHVAPRWRRVKYGLLLVILFAAALGSLTLLILDPLGLFVRTVTSVVLPGLHWLVSQAQLVLYRVPSLWGPLDLADSLLRGTILSHKQPYYYGVVPIAATMGGILALNLIARRAWCRFLCPLGGLLSLVSRASWLKRTRTGSCAYCGGCEDHCRMGTIDINRHRASDSGECILCMDCAVACQQSAVRFAGAPGVDRGWGYDPTRRQALGALGLSLGGLAILRSAPAAHEPNAYRLRPPGAIEEDLLATCVRCAACIRACPTHGLQPSLTESGLEGLWTPILTPRLGPCDYSCTACGQICPTGAIPQLDLDTKRETPIGKAYIDETICIAWSGRGPCIVCEEMCPVPDKAILLEPLDTVDGAGNAQVLQVPVVHHERCIGCGLCESKCPTRGEAAIRVVVDPMT